ncbi:hypothetical protein MPF19_16670 [Polaribacter sp. Z014]|uniref:hypothetical protein n=1 Tax=Polaribacter sp. Z014 TaxID=2927126 RepID=UPI00202105E7|nr:hypothetical protein [Polaribacter sp. Z014]MCL7765059.1 hypothetical protein [Polaribacter sp. Z014]
MNTSIEKHNWTDWKDFPDPRKGDYVSAPFGFGLYQLKNFKTNEFILFGIGNNCAYRMSSLLPKPFGQGTRNNEAKRDFVLENLKDIKYRTLSFTDVEEMKRVEKEIKVLKRHQYNT